MGIQAAVEETVFLLVEIEGELAAELLSETALVVDVVAQGPPGPPGDFGGVLDGGNF